MQYNNTSNLNGIIQELERLTDLGYGYISGNTDRLKEATAMINQDNRSILSLIINSASHWQYDDNNREDLPIATTNIVSGTGSYALPDIVGIERVEVQDENDRWIKLEPISINMIPDAVDEFQGEGTPEFYSLINGVIKFYPEPNYSKDDALKVYYSRDVVDFLTTDTTKTPGFVSVFHQLLPLKTAIRWLKTKQANAMSLPAYIADEQRLEASLVKHYQTRFKDLKPKIRRARQSYL